MDIATTFIFLLLFQLSISFDSQNVFNRPPLSAANNFPDQFNSRRKPWNNNKLLDGPCPFSCSCRGLNIDCSFRNLNAVPKDIPRNVEKLILRGNKIASLRSDDFQTLGNLRILQLMDNEIQDIQKGTFNTLTNLRKLRLNSNQLKELRDGLFVNNKQMRKLDLKGNRLTCIHKNNLNGLMQLKSLILSHNNIVWIAKDVFRTLPNLVILDLADNPLNCNCHLRWLHLYLQQQRMVTTTTSASFEHQAAHCATPNYLTGRKLVSLSLQDFHCSDEERNAIIGECGTQKCSQNCSCTSDANAICRSRGLTIVPQDLPDTIQEIDLQANDIEMLHANVFIKYRNLRKLFLNGNKLNRIHPDAFSGLEKLTALHLNHNHLKDLPDKLFSNLNNLRFLYLHDNEISCLPRTIFYGLKSLLLLHLSENKIESIFNGTFTDLRSLRYLYMENNPLHCDCHLSWLPDALNGRDSGLSPDNTFGTCYSPLKMKGSQVHRIATHLFKCSNDEENKNMEKCKISQHCPLGCFCHQFTVNCSHARLTHFPDDIPQNTEHLIFTNNSIDVIYEDSILKKLKNLRILNLSHNKIRLIESGSFAANVDLTELDLSFNQLTIVNEEFASGLLNLTKLSLQYNNNLRCLSNGTFSWMPRLKELCICSGDWHSKYCKEKLEICTYINCHHGGQCVSVDSGHLHRCNCQPGFQGRFCQFAVSQLNNDSPCSLHECQNGARCEALGSGYRCACPSGYSGQYCDQLYQLHFSVGTFTRISLPKDLMNKPKTNVTLTFTARQENGILLYFANDATSSMSFSQDKGPFMVLELFNNHIRFAYSVGKSPPAEVYSITRVIRGESYRVDLDIHGENVSMFINKRHHSALRAPYDVSKRYIDFTSSIYLGGAPATTLYRALSHRRTKSDVGFTGCIGDVHINDRVINFLPMKDRSVIVIGSVTPCKSSTKGNNNNNNECVDTNYCLNGGTCQTGLSSTNILHNICHCPQGFIGPRCEQELSCQRRDTVQHMRDPVTRCVSLRKVKIRTCEGNCKLQNNTTIIGGGGGRHCCTAVRHKTRRIRFECHNGNVYTKQIQLVDQCNCSVCQNTLEIN